MTVIVFDGKCLYADTKTSSSRDDVLPHLRSDKIISTTKDNYLF